jgi:hypothetical protein
MPGKHLHNGLTDLGHLSELFLACQEGIDTKYHHFGRVLLSKGANHEAQRHAQIVTLQKANTHLLERCHLICFDMVWYFESTGGDISGTFNKHRKSSLLHVSFLKQGTYVAKINGVQKLTNPPKNRAVM